ncbi:TolC family protein [Sphingomonas sp.]|uniref:TolC family protein n=1 Tax=Sphingomonas sp. TaxID=28214 RepID=UPI00286DE55B|nr:TolC family protein [Sphingomonas sp.]
MRFHRSLAIASSALTLAACAAVGPDHRPPPVSAAAQANFVGANAAGVSQAPVEPGWWRLYQDPVLDGLVEQALAANTDLAIAAANIAAARASLRGARSDRLPQTELGGSAQYGRPGGAERLPGQGADTSLATGFDVAYEIDLFGRVRRGIEASRADLDAELAARDAVRVIVAAETARAYGDSLATARRLEVANRTVALLDQSVSLADKRFRAGRTSRLDLVRVGALRAQQAARIPELEGDLDAAGFRLATLTGRPPAERPTIARDGRPLTLARPIPIGDGRTLLARRPDVREAERRLAASTARIGVATADLYPRISLGGSLTSTASSVAGLLSGGAIGFLLGPLINWSFPNQAGIRARIAGAEAQAQGDLARFDKAVLTALEETETALSRYANEIERRAALQAAASEAPAAARITRAQLREGRADGLAVLDAERTLANAEADLAEADDRLIDAQVNLFRALGGGWQAGIAGA